MTASLHNFIFYNEQNLRRMEKKFCESNDENKKNNFGDKIVFGTVSDLKINSFEKYQETNSTTPIQGGPFAP